MVQTLRPMRLFKVVLLGCFVHVGSFYFALVPLQVSLAHCLADIKPMILNSLVW